jgi:hypothetical protein
MSEIKVSEVKEWNGTIYALSKVLFLFANDNFRLYNYQTLSVTKLENGTYIVSIIVFSDQVKSYVFTVKKLELVFK